MQQPALCLLQSRRRSEPRGRLASDGRKSVNQRLIQLLNGRSTRVDTLRIEDDRGRGWERVQERRGRYRRDRRGARGVD